MFINAILDKHTVKNYLSSKDNVYFGILHSLNNDEHFKFNGKKNIFSLGSANKVDFKVKDPTVDANHAYFIKDICGIKIIPLSENTFINNELIKEEKLLNNNDVLKLGNLSYIFNEKEELVKLPVLVDKKSNNKYKNTIYIVFFVNLLLFVFIMINYLLF